MPSFSFFESLQNCVAVFTSNPLSSHSFAAAKMKKRGVNVQPRTGETHGMFGVKFLKYHNIRDPDWKADDLITQYERLSNIYRKLQKCGIEWKCQTNFLRNSEPERRTAARTRRDQVRRRVHPHERRSKEVARKVECFAERRRPADEEHFPRQRREAAKVQEQAVLRAEGRTRPAVVLCTKAY